MMFFYFVHSLVQETSTRKLILIVSDNVVILDILCAFEKSFAKYNYIYRPAYIDFEIVGIEALLHRTTLLFIDR